MASLEKSITFYGDNDTKFTYNMNDTNMLLITAIFKKMGHIKKAI